MRDVPKLSASDRDTLKYLSDLSRAKAARGGALRTDMPGPPDYPLVLVTVQQS